MVRKLYSRYYYILALLLLSLQVYCATLKNMPQDGNVAYCLQCISPSMSHIVCNVYHRACRILFAMYITEHVAYCLQCISPSMSHIVCNVYHRACRILFAMYITEHVAYCLQCISPST